MEKASHVIDSGDRNHPVKLLSLEGTVDFAEGNVTMPDSFPNLTIRLSNNKARIIWIRGGSHRMDVGENVRVHYSPNSSPIVAGAYEILELPMGKKLPIDFTITTVNLLIKTYILNLFFQKIFKLLKQRKISSQN